jgi:hypothetical protein
MAENRCLAVLGAGAVMPCMPHPGVGSVMMTVGMAVGMRVFARRGRSNEQTSVHMDMLAASVYMIKCSGLRLSEQTKKAGEDGRDNPARAYKATNAQHGNLASFRSGLTS